MSLLDQAAISALPELQYMDTSTLTWIVANNPHVNMSPDKKHSPLPFNISLDTSWLANAQLADTLHGLRHLTRCAYLCLRLTQDGSVKVTNEEARLVTVAGLFHDARRLNDKGDSGHAQRSADWLRANAQTVLPKYDITPELQTVNTLAIIIALHETPYSDMTREQLKQYGAHKDLVDILKTADALDRYRLPKLTWWPDDRHLSLIASDKLKQDAYNLVVASERLFLEGEDSATSVQKAIGGPNA